MRTQAPPRYQTTGLRKCHFTIENSSAYHESTSARAYLEECLEEIQSLKDRLQDENLVLREQIWNVREPLNPAKKHLIAVLRDEIRQPEKQPLRLTIPREERLARVADALLDDVGDNRTLDDWAHIAGMARRTFMRAFSAQVGMSFGRWRQQARLFAVLEMLAQRKSVTEVAIAVGYDSVSSFIEMFRTMLGTTPQAYFRGM